MKNNLDKFESFINGSLENHEASYSASAWDKMQAKMNTSANGFESFIKESLDNHKIPYSASAWIRLQQALTKVPFYKTKWFIGSASVLVAGIMFLAIPSNGTNKKNIVVNTKKDITINTNSQKENIATKTISKTNKKNNKVSINEKPLVSSDNNLIKPNNNITTESANEDSNIKNDNISNNTNSTNKTSLANNNTQDGVNDLNDNTKNESGLTPQTPETSYLVSFVSKPIVCENEELILSPKNKNKDLLYKWEVNGHLASDNTNLRINGFSVQKPGIYNVKLIAALKKNKKEVGSFSQTIEVVESPKEMLYETTPYSLVNNHQFEVDEDVRVVWNFGDGETATTNKATHVYKKQGRYKLTYSVENKNKCRAFFTKNIDVKGYYNIRTDHGFSPDGDGSLDYFLPEELRLINQPFEMIIFNRTGKEVFKTTDINTPWDGKDQTGNMVKFGIYIWVINLTNELGEKEQYKGTVTKATNN